MKVDRNRVIDAFDAYVAPYDITDEKIKLKVVHTRKVADLCDAVAQSLNLASDDVDAAWLCGMLHDIGRFEQVRRFGTFVDAKSVNHAEFGADLLFSEGLITRFVDECDPLVEVAIRNHNRLVVDSGLDERAHMFCDILRDADKVDILRAIAESPIEEIYNTSTEELRAAAITPEVEEVFYQKRCVPRSLHRSVVDHLVGHFCFAFELVYPLSMRAMSEQGFLWILMNTPSDNAQTAGKLVAMRQFMAEHLEQGA